MKKHLLFIILLLLFASLFAEVGIVRDSVSDVSVSNVKPDVVVAIVKDTKANFNIIKDTIAQLKEGKLSYLLTNMIAILALVVGLSRWIAKALVLLLTLMMKITPDNIDEKLKKVISGLTKFLEVITNLFGWLSFSKKKGTDAITTVK